MYHSPAAMGLNRTLSRKSLPYHTKISTLNVDIFVHATPYSSAVINRTLSPSRTSRKWLPLRSSLRRIISAS